MYKQTEKTKMTNRITSGVLAFVMFVGLFLSWPLGSMAAAAEPDYAQVAVEPEVIEPVVVAPVVEPVVVVGDVMDVWDGSVANGFGGGSGTAANPYRIYTGAQLAYLAATTNAGNTYENEYFLLMNDIDLNGIEWDPIGYTDIVGVEKDFRGAFDGGYHEIFGMAIHVPQHASAGLFGYMEDGYATIKNLGVMDFEISGTFSGRDYYAIGGIAGWISGDVSMQSEKAM